MHCSGITILSGPTMLFSMYWFVVQDNILAQLALEESTRERLLHWDRQLSRVTNLVEEVGGVRMIGYVARLAKTVLSGLNSPLSQSYCSRAWVVLSHGVIGEWRLGE